MSRLLNRPLVALALLAIAAPSTAASPPSGTVSSTTPEVGWTGGPLLPTASATCGGPSNPGCDNFALTLDPPAYPFRLEILLTASAADDYDLEVYDSGGGVVGSSGNGPGAPESVILTNPPGGLYTVSASPFAPVGPYAPLARIVPEHGRASAGERRGRPPALCRAAAGEPNATFFPRFGYGPSFGDAGIGLSSGEPTLGSPHAINLAQQASTPHLTNVMFLDYVHTLRVTFDDCTDPATAEWRERSVPTHVTSLDPILHVDPLTGSHDLGAAGGEDEPHRHQRRLGRDLDPEPGRRHQLRRRPPDDRRRALPTQRSRRHRLRQCRLLRLAGRGGGADRPVARRRRHLRSGGADVHPRPMRRPARPHPGQPRRRRRRAQQELRRRAGRGGQRERRASPSSSTACRARPPAAATRPPASAPTRRSTSASATAAGRRWLRSRPTWASRGRRRRTSAPPSASSTAPSRRWSPATAIAPPLPSSAAPRLATAPPPTRPTTASGTSTWR